MREKNERDTGPLILIKIYKHLRSIFHKLNMFMEKVRPPKMRPLGGGPRTSRRGPLPFRVVVPGSRVSDIPISHIYGRD